MTPPSIVLVHGALSDASVWRDVAPRLIAQGHEVHAPAIPLRGLASDVAHLNAYLETVEGPRILVGHSYGGTIISHSDLDLDSVTAVVFVSAFAPDTGESTGELNERWPGSLLGEATTTVRESPDGPQLYLKTADFADVYAADLPRELTDVLAVSQRPINPDALGETFSGAPTWRSPDIASAALVSTDDHSLPVAAQRAMAERAGAAVREVAASHASPLSQPRPTAQLILETAGARSPAWDPPSHPHPPPSERPHHMSASHLDEPLERNAAFAATDAKDRVPEIPFVPNRQLYLITCIDPRVDPADTLGLALGDAIVARNVGGRVSPPVIKDLAWIVHLHANVTPDADWFEIAVIHHTDCGSGLLADDDLRAGYVARGGWDDATSRALAVVDPHRTVREDVEKLRAAPELRPGIEHIRVGGYVYDVETGRITTVVEPA